MRIDKVTEHSIEITLSKRNCLTLAAKAEDEASQRTLRIANDQNMMLVVRVEDDATHYKHRTPGYVVPQHNPDRTVGCL